MISTKNFKPDVDIKLLCTCGNPKCDKRSVKQSVLNKVQLIRSEANRPLRITSGGRCQYHPNETHRTKPADHQKGIAVDIAYKTDKESAQLIALGVKHGATAIGLGKTFVHLGWREQSYITTWGY